FQQLEIDYVIAESKKLLLPQSSAPTVILRIFGVTKKSWYQSDLVESDLVAMAEGLNATDPAQVLAPQVGGPSVNPRPLNTRTRLDQLEDKMQALSRIIDQVTTLEERLGGFSDDQAHVGELLVTLEGVVEGNMATLLDQVAELSSKADVEAEEKVDDGVSKLIGRECDAQALYIVSLGKAMAVAVEPSKEVASKKKNLTEKRRVVVTGMGVVSGVGHDPDVFYENLLEGVSGISEIEAFDCSLFPTVNNLHSYFFTVIVKFDPVVSASNHRLEDCLMVKISGGTA
ncbi:hypothetical protein GIB67_018622, partial [Kingdonia uniflora]